MIKIYIGSSLDPKEVIADENKTVADAYREANVSLPKNSVVTLNSSRLGERDIDTRSLSELGVKENDLVIVSEKLNSAK